MVLGGEASGSAGLREEQEGMRCHSLLFQDTPLPEDKLRQGAIVWTEGVLPRAVDQGECALTP